MNDIDMHPFSPASVAAESSDHSPDWDLFANECERLFGHPLDGTTETDGYSLDEALAFFNAGHPPHAYVVMAATRPQYKGSM